MENIELQKKIESILFWKGEPVKTSELAGMLEVKENEIDSVITSLQESMANRGLSIIVHDKKAVMTTAPSSASIIEKLQKEELTKDLSKAALETLSIILYRGPMRRSSIDYIRGVNSQFILRILLVRGLIEKRQDPKDERAFIYRPTLEMLAHLGLQKIEDLPEFTEVNTDIDAFLSIEEENE